MIRLRVPANTVRLRLTALYGALFLASGAGLLAVTYVLVARRYHGTFFIKAGEGAGLVVSGTGQVPVTGAASVPPASTPFPKGVPTPEQVVAQAHAQTTAALHQLVIQSGIALAIMALISIWLGWLVAGRVLRPLRTITSAARDISSSNLHRRLALDGPDDELTELGNTFDGLLERLEASFDAQRQFVANASHELRTPLTLERALIEVALSDPDASVDSLREACDQVLRVGKQQERLIEALLTLSRSQRGLERREPIDLAAVAAEMLEGLDSDSVRIDAALEPANTSGDPHLIERLIANLVGNAMGHNVGHGWIEVTTRSRAARAIFSVKNSGPVVPPGEIDRLLQPFQRLDGARTSNGDGIGLGLSIVHAIAIAHDATFTARARPSGGLDIEISFPGPRAS